MVEPLKPKTLRATFGQWFDSAITNPDSMENNASAAIDWLRVIPFILMH